MVSQSEPLKQCRNEGENMKLKKWISFVLSIMLVLSSSFSSINAFAEQESDTTVKLVNSVVLFSSKAYTIHKSSKGKFLVTLDLQQNKAKNRIVYELTFGDNPTGWLINIGNSITNNGYGGDSGSQSNDSELQIVNGTMCVYCNDYGSGRLLFSEQNCATPNGKIRIEISDNTVTYYNYQTKITKTWTSPYIFALNGQSDDAGPVNYVIYTGINRVIDGEYRSGNGVINAILKVG
jgi:hypothetical protein